MVPIPTADLDKEAKSEDYEKLSKEISKYLDEQFKPDLAYTNEEVLEIQKTAKKEFSGKAPGEVLETLVNTNLLVIVDIEHSIRGSVFTRRAAEKYKAREHKLDELLEEANQNLASLE